MKKIKKEIPFITIALLPFVYLAFIWNRLPEKVPTHWNASGEIDNYGNKSELFFFAYAGCWASLSYFISYSLCRSKAEITKHG